MKEGAKCLENDPLGIKILLIYDGIGENTAAARTVRSLKTSCRHRMLSSWFRKTTTTPKPSW